MALLKEDGSLDIEHINKLPIEEYMEVIGELTETQYKEYLSKIPLNESKETTKAVLVNYLMEEDGENWSQRFDNMRKNFSGQKEIDDLRDIKEKLIKLIDARKINPNTTIAQLVGGKYNGNKFGTITGMEANRRAGIAKRGGKHFE